MSTEATHPTTQQVADSAPHGRRRSHIIASIFGLAQGAWVMALAAFVVKYQGPNFGFSYQAEQYLLALPLAVAAFVVCRWVERYYARNSSLGAVVAGVFLLGGSLVLLWLQKYFTLGLISFVCAMLLFGGAMGMRRARRAGRREAVYAQQMAKLDQQPGQVPLPPPSRKSDHVLSLVITPLLTVFALVATGFSSGVVAGADVFAANAHTFSHGKVLFALVAGALLLLSVGALSGNSTAGTAATAGTIFAFYLALCAGILLGIKHPLFTDPASYIVIDPVVWIFLAAVMSPLARGSHWARQAGRTQMAAQLAMETNKAAA